MIVILVHPLDTLPRPLERTRRPLAGRVTELTSAHRALLLASGHVRGLRGRNPAVAFSEAPLALPLRLVLEVVEHARAVLDVVFPLSYEAVAAGPHLGAPALHLTALELSFVNGLVGPHHFSFALHIVVLELTLVEAARIGEVVLPDAMELTIDEVALVVAALELESALAGLLALNKIAGKLDLVIVPRLGAVPVLLIVLPLALVH